MRAWRVEAYGDYRTALQLGEAPDTPPPGAIWIRNHAIALNFPDLLAIAGQYQVKSPLPFTPGMEAMGVVEAAPEGSAFRPGDRVMAMNIEGAYAELMPAYELLTFRVPDAMDDHDAAAFLMAYQTSYFALVRRARTRAGEVVLVHGGAGGVGSAAIQIAKALGATVIATASTDAKLQVCRDSGADHVVNYREQDFVDAVKQLTGGRGADVIFEPVGGDVFDQSTKCIAWEGRLVVIGFASGRIPTIAANRILLKNISIVGLQWGAYPMHDPQRIAQTQNALYELYAAGKLRPVIGATLPFARLPEGLAALAERRAIGKILIDV